MTLLLGKRCDSHVELGGDGHSTSEELMKKVGRTTLQKLFKSDKHHFAVAHAGPNAVVRNGECSASAIVEDFLGTLANQEQEIRLPQLAQSLAAIFKAAIGNGKKEETILWVAGFDTTSNAPQLWRVSITASKEIVPPERIPLQCAKAGTGAKYVADSFGGLRETYQQALKARVAGDNTFGGHWHELRISRGTPPTWIERPTKSTLGFAEILGKSHPTGQRDIQVPKDSIEEKFRQLKQALDIRCRRRNGKSFQSPIRKLIERWEKGAPDPAVPELPKACLLTAMGNEARVAESSDVSQTDALFYEEEFDLFVKALPSLPIA